MEVPQFKREQAETEGARRVTEYSVCSAHSQIHSPEVDERQNFVDSPRVSPLTLTIFLLTRLYWRYHAYGYRIRSFNYAHFGILNVS